MIRSMRIIARIIGTGIRQYLTLLSNIDGLALPGTNKLIVNSQNASGFFASVAFGTVFANDVLHTCNMR